MSIHIEVLLNEGEYRHIRLLTAPPFEVATIPGAVVLVVGEYKILLETPIDPFERLEEALARIEFKGVYEALQETGIADLLRETVITFHESMAEGYAE